MKVTIDSNVAEKNNLTLQEVLVLLLNIQNSAYTEIKQSLIDKGIADQSARNIDKLVVSDNTKNLVSNILITSESTEENPDEIYEDIADAIRQVYPSGRKSGTTYSWRGSKMEITHRLKVLHVKYGLNIDKDKLVDITRRYVESFNGNYTYMPLLKYFLIKYDKTTIGDVDLKSPLMTIIDNGGVIEPNDNNWAIDLR